MKAWRAWGSAPNDRIGSWISFKWSQTKYLDTIHYVPGDERAPGYFDKKCARPATIEVQGDFENRTIELEDVRGHQYIVFEPPMVTETLKFKITKIRGSSEEGGVCFAAISFYNHKDPLQSVPHLKERVNESIALLKKPLMRKTALTRLMSLGPVVSAQLLKQLRSSKGKDQQLYLDSVADFLNRNQLEDLKKIKSSISEENQGLYIRALAALGDPVAAQEILKHVDELLPEEQAKILLSIAKSHDPYHLTFLLSKYGKHPEVDQAIKPHIARFPEPYEQVLKLYNSQQGQRRAAYLELLSKIDPVRALPMIDEAMNHKEDPMHQSGAIRASAYTNDQDLRYRVRALNDSVYVVVRRAVAFALAEWGREEDSELLMNLAQDRAMSVRIEALTALGRLKGTGNFLKSYAIFGSDEATAEAAASAWMNGEDRLTIQAPLKLLSSTFSKVRSRAIQFITDHQAEACPALANELFTAESLFPEHLQVLEALWQECSDNFVTLAKAAPLPQKLRIMSIVSQLYKPEMKPLISEFALTDEHKLQIAVAKASVSLSAEEANRIISPYLQSSFITTRCEAIKALAHFQTPEALSVIKQGIRSGLKDPYQTDRAWLLCTLKASSHYQDSSLIELLSKAYEAWSRSIGFVSYRLEAVKAVSKSSSSAQRLELLFKASTDIDRQVRAIALEALKAE